MVPLRCRGCDCILPRVSDSMLCQKCELHAEGKSAEPRVGIWKLTGGLTFGRITLFSELVEEAKNRFFVFVFLVMMLAYILSITSNSLLLNIPISFVLVVILKRISNEFHIRLKASPSVQYRNIYSNLHQVTSTNLIYSSEQSYGAEGQWRKAIDSPNVETAIENLLQSVIKEFISDAFYDELTPDKEMTNELHFLLCNAMGEIATRLRKVNIVSVLTRDMVQLLSDQLDLYRRTRENLGGHVLDSLSSAERDERMKLGMAASGKLHIACINPESEYRVIRKLAEGILCKILKPQDLGCSVFRSLVREIVTCCVFRPVLRFGNPSYLNGVFLNYIAPMMGEKASRMARNATSIKKGNFLNSKTNLSGTSQTVLTAASIASASSIAVSTQTVQDVHTGEPVNEMKSFHKSSSFESFILSVKENTRNQSGQGLTFSPPGQSGRLYSTISSCVSSSTSVSNAISFNPSSPSTWVPSSTSESNLATVAGISNEKKHTLTGNNVPGKKQHPLTPEHLDNVWTKGRNYKVKDAKFTNKEKKSTDLLATREHNQNEHTDRLPESSMNYPIKNSISQTNPLPNPDRHENANKQNPSNSTDMKLSLVLDMKGEEGSSQRSTKPYGVFEDNKSNRDTKQITRLVEDLDLDDEDDLNIPGIGFFGTKEKIQDKNENEFSESSDLEGSRRGTDVMKLNVESKSDSLFQTNEFRDDDSLSIGYYSPKSDITSNRSKEKVKLKSIKSKSVNGADVKTSHTSMQEQRSVYTQRRTVRDKDGFTSSKTKNSTETSCDWNEEFRVDWERKKFPSYQQLAEANGLLDKTGSPAFHLQARVTKALLAESSFGGEPYVIYCISVLDSDGSTWNITRRYRSFEELHRRLKDVPLYRLSLPPKRYLAHNFDHDFVHERRVLLDAYLRELMSIPSLAELPEVGEFLSKDSVLFGSNSSSLHTLAVLDDGTPIVRKSKEELQIKQNTVNKQTFQSYSSLNTIHEEKKKNFIYDGNSTLRKPKSHREMDYWNVSDKEKTIPNPDSQEYIDIYDDHDYDSIHHQTFDSDSNLSEQHFAGKVSSVLGAVDYTRKRVRGMEERGKLNKRPSVDLTHENLIGDSISGDEFESVDSESTSELEEESFPPEWNISNLSVPLMNLVGVVFQLHRNGWLRRQVMWIARQILKLGMGDAIDDFLLSKIQILRKSDFITKVVKYVHETLWPGGVYYKKLAMSGDSSRNMQNKSKPDPLGIHVPQPSFQQRLEASKKAFLVRDILLEAGPTALVSLIGNQQYKRGARDVYNFLQSPIYMKQLTHGVLEVLLLAAFPELHSIVVEIHKGNI